MPHSRGELVQSLRRLGLKAGDIVMMHASLRATGKVYGGPDQVHLAVEDATSPGGAVMMFVGCPDGYDDIGRGVYSPNEEAEIVAHQPAFDPQTTRANPGFGALAELFRSYPKTVCSSSVCGRMAARGDHAAWLVADQPWNYGFGAGSPLAKLCDAGGKVLLLGSSHDDVTLLHHAEHIAEIKGKRIARYKVPVMVDGGRAWVDCEEVDTNCAHENWTGDFFSRIVDAFIRRNQGTPACAEGRVGGAKSVLMDAALLVAHAASIMERRARDRQSAV